MDFNNSKVCGDTSTFDGLVWKEIIWLLETLFHFRRKLYLPVRNAFPFVVGFFSSNVSQFVFSSFFATKHELSRNCHTRTFGFQRSSMKYQNEKLSLFKRCLTRFSLKKKGQQNIKEFNKISDFIETTSLLTPSTYESVLFSCCRPSHLESFDKFIYR